MALALTPKPRRSLSQWAEQERVVPTEASANAGRWSNALFPFLTEIMDCLNPWHWSEVVSFCKSAQVGGTEIIINWLLAIATDWPGPTLAVQPTIAAAQAWSREKMAPSIAATPAARNVINDQKSRDGASTTLFKSFPRGFMILTGANSSPDISSKSIRNVAKDEWDRWPDDVDGQGDPDSLVNARQISYHASGQAKTLQVSTPTVLGATTARIWPAFLAGDQRRYHVPCPHCEREQILRFKPIDASGRGGLKFDSKAQNPGATAVYICEFNGCVIEHWQKREMIARGRWASMLPEAERAGRQPSFHINALYSPVTTWAKMVEAFLAAKDDPRKLKAFTNLWLGEPWEERGDAPEIERLLGRRDNYTGKVIPVGGLLVFIACDVQKDGIYYEVWVVGRDRVNWSIDVGYLEGDTADSENQVWKDLEAMMNRGWPDTFGNWRTADAEGVDAGFNTNAVYLFCRRRHKCKALKGDDGWYLPALGTPSKQDVNFRGKKKRRGVMLWPVGTWSIKSEFYSALALHGLKEGAAIDPPGYCHFSDQIHDEGYFKQATAESLTNKDKKGKPIVRNGKVVNIWVQNGPNHYLDCRVYNMALAEHFGVKAFSTEDWARIAAHRERAPEGAQADMAVLWGSMPAQTPQPVTTDSSPAAPPAPVTPAPKAARESLAERMARLNR